MKTKKDMQGAAIFMALLIIVIVSGITVLLSGIQRIQIRRTQMMLTADQTYLYADGVLDWAISTLGTDLIIPFPPSAWPLLLPTTPTPDGMGKITGLLIDAQGLFNINNFAFQGFAQTNQLTQNNSVSPNQKIAMAATPIHWGANPSDPTKVFRNLLAVLKIPLSQQQQDNLISAIGNWVTSTHARMNGISELRMVQGMSPEIYNRLLPYIVALPTSTDINTQHAPPVIVQAVQMNNASQVTQIQQNNSQSQNQSQYFLLRADVYLQDQHLILYSLLQRITDKNNRTNITPLWKSFGTE